MGFFLEGFFIKMNKVSIGKAEISYAYFYWTAVNEYKFEIPYS